VNLCLLLKVLGNGEVLEFDSPTNLLLNSHSYFVSLVNQTGAAEAEYLRTLAQRPDMKTKETQPDITMDEVSENDPLIQ
jgi:hypothetical protein